MASHFQIAGVILAGGGSRRMLAADAPVQDFIQDKALLDLAGRPMLAHVIERFRPQVAKLILNANGDPVRFQAFDLAVVADDPDPDAEFNLSGRGPLAGLVAAFAWAERLSGAVTSIATVSGDAPFLPGDLVARLVEATAGLSETPAIAISSGRRHPTIALWPLALAEDLRNALSRGELSADRFAKRHAAIEVDFPMRQIGGRDVDPFFNANTRDDLEDARRILAGIAEIK